MIDPITATLYVVAKTKENGSYFQRLHALDLATGWVGGSPGMEKFGGPMVVRVSSSQAFDSLTENQRSALLLAAGKVYVAFDSYGDTGSFHGWLFAYDAANLQNALAVFNSTPNASSLQANGGGIGQGGAAPSSDVTPSSSVAGNVFVATSDGTPFDPNLSGDYAETLLKLQMNSGTPVIDYFTPWNETTLNFTHKNFGSTGVLLLPNSAGSFANPHLAVAGSEAGSLYLLNRDNLGGFSSVPNVDNVLQTLCLTVSGAPASILGTPAYWPANNTAYLAAAFDSLKAFPLANGVFTSPVCPAAAVPSAQSTDILNFFGNSFGASPVISWDGSSAGSGIVWALDTSGYSASPPQPAILYAYRATDLSRLYMSPSSVNGLLPAAGPAVKFAVPTVANGKVYVGTQSELSVFALQ